MQNDILKKKEFYLIAEIGGNHQGSFEKANQLCDLAISSGSDCIKFQLYSADNLVNKELSKDRYEHFKKFELTKNEHIFLAKKCLNAGLDYTASVWDLNMFEWIEPYVTFIKVGSGDLTAYNFLKKFALTNKPIILSTGLSSFDEVKNAVIYIRNVNSAYKDKGMITLMQCTSMYPIRDCDVNLSVLNQFSQIENIFLGYSDHTKGISALEKSLAFGARILEFHFTDDKHNKTFRDHQVSLEINDVKELKKNCVKMLEMIGSPIKKPIEIEINNGHLTSFRRGVYPTRNIKKGTSIKDSDLCCLRPYQGLCASKYDLLIGKTAKFNINKYQPLSLDMFD